MRKKYIIANWKANPSTAGLAEGLVLAVRDYVKSNKLRLKATVVIAPPYLYLGQIADSCKGAPLYAASQNFFHKEEGPYTSQVTASMVKNSGAKYVILGHSEVREENHDDDQRINQKIRLAIKYGLTPIICLGEKEKGQYKKVLSYQFRHSLAAIRPSDFKKMILAYEPVWAISKGSASHQAAGPKQAEEAHLFLRTLVASKYGGRIAANLSIIYGGSVKPENAKALFSQPDIDGGLVGGASLEVKKFISIIKAF